MTTDSPSSSTPFLIRTFIKIGTFHRLSQFDDSAALPTTDEQQLFAWPTTTLRTLLLTLRNTAPLTAEYRHPLARFGFRAVYADPTNKGRFSQKDLGTVYSRDLLGEPGTVDSPAKVLLQDEDEEKEGDRSLEELRFVPGDYLCVAVMFPKSVPLPGEPKTTTTPASGNGWKAGDAGWGGQLSAPAAGRGGGGHWRGTSNTEGRGGRGGRGGRDRTPPPPSRGEGGWARGGGRGRGGRRSRSRSPPRRRYD